MNFQSLCCMCCGDRQEFWDKLARQLQRYRFCANGDCTDDPTQAGAGGEGGEMDAETFMFMGFMALPMLFVMYGLFQRAQGRRRQITQSKPSSPNTQQGPPQPPVD